MKRERMTNPKCLGRAIPDTFSARSADLMDLKMRRITRGASFDHLVGEREHHRRHANRVSPSDDVRHRTNHHVQITGFHAAGMSR